MGTELLKLCPLCNAFGIIKSRQENWTGSFWFCVIFEANVDSLLDGLKEHLQMAGIGFYYCVFKLIFFNLVHYICDRTWNTHGRK